MVRGSGCRSSELRHGADEDPWPVSVGIRASARHSDRSRTGHGAMGSIVAAKPWRCCLDGKREHDDRRNCSSWTRTPDLPLSEHQWAERGVGGIIARATTRGGGSAACRTGDCARRRDRLRRHRMDDYRHRTGPVHDHSRLVTLLRGNGQTQERPFDVHAVLRDRGSGGGSLGHLRLQPRVRRGATPSSAGSARRS